MRRTVFLRAGAAAALGLGTYVAVDEDRRRVANLTAQSTYRIANLVTTVGSIVVDYGVTIKFGAGKSESNAITRQITSLNAEIERIQTDQERLTIEQWRQAAQPDVVKALQRQIDSNRQRLDEAAEEVGSLVTEHESFRPLKDVHNRSAIRLRDMCAANQGLYIKLGQHLAMLDHILPEEYHRHLSTLLANTPRSPWAAVRRVIKQELGQEPEVLFARIDPEPIASASLAQVHIAYGHDGQKYAVKCQHEGLRESAAGDMAVITFLVYAVSRLFEGFDYNWLTREMNQNMPLELDFTVERGNMEKCARLMADMVASGDVAVPTSVPALSAQRVLTMSFEEGNYISDLDALQRRGLGRADVSTLVSRIFCEQMYRHGFVHCDPHEANLLVREHPHRRGKPQVVLLDHGLYRELGPAFRTGYCRLWRGLLLGDERTIREECEKMNSGPAYTLLAAMLTMRPWDDIVSDDVGRLRNKNTKGDAVMLRGYAKKYFSHIIKLLGSVDSELLLLLKTNDCLRHIDKRLGTPVNSVAVVGGTVADVLLKEELLALATGPHPGGAAGAGRWRGALWDYGRLQMRVGGLATVAAVLDYTLGWERWAAGWWGYIQRGGGPRPEEIATQAQAQAEVAAAVAAAVVGGRDESKAGGINSLPRETLSLAR